MPNVVVYIGAEDARRIEEAGGNLKQHVRDIVRRALDQERAKLPPAPLPGQTSIDVEPDPKVK